MRDFRKKILSQPGFRSLREKLTLLNRQNRRLTHRWKLWNENFRIFFILDVSSRSEIMASYKEGKEDMQTEQEQVHKIRITITSKNCAAIERISNELVKAAKDKQLKVKVKYVTLAFLFQTKINFFLLNFKQELNLRI